MATAKQNAANRQNAQRSSGPRSDEGKKASSRNALKHGLTAEMIVLPNENAEAFKAELNTWLDHDQPTDPLHLAAVERTFEAHWKLKRSTKVETATLGEQVRHAVDDFDLKAYILAAETGKRLLFDPVNRCEVDKKDRHSLEQLKIFHANDPVVLAKQLEGTAAGAAWMIKRWKELGRILDAEGFWHYPEKFAALKLMGLRPQDVLDDFNIARVFIACNALHPEAWDLWDDFHQARIGCDGKPTYRIRVEGLKNMIPDQAYATGMMKKMVDEQMQRLVVIKTQHLDPRNILDREAAVARAMFDSTPSGALFHRYECSLTRNYHKAVADLLKIRKEALKPDPSDTPSRAIQQNEPNPEPLTQQEDTPTPSSPTPFSPPTPPAQPINPYQQDPKTPSPPPEMTPNRA